MKKAKLGKPKSSWQLYGAGSVGSQSLMGIPHVHELQQTLHNCLIWPFQTGLRSLDDEALENVSTLMVEIYPSQLNVTPEEGEVIDAAQMRTIAHHYCDLDGRGKLAELFAGNYAPSDTQLEQIVGEEGWILPK